MTRDGEKRHGLSLLVGWTVRQPFGYCLLPGIGLVAGFLLRLDVLVFKLLIRPPFHSLSIQVHGFGEELIAVARECVGIDEAPFDGPEPPAAGLVAQIHRLVRCADEET